MRLEKVLKNGFVGVLSQIVMMIMGFITQKIVLEYLGRTILGLNGVVENLLGMLMLAELGVGSAITFHLYRPLAEGDEDTIASIMLLFKRLYRRIGIVVFAIGCLLMLFLPFFIQGEQIDFGYIRVVYFIQLLSTVSTYFLSYKRTLLYADQKNYICALYDTLMNIVFGLLRIAAVLMFKSNIIYLILIMLQQIASNLLISHYSNKNFPKLKDKNIPVYEKKGNVFQNMKDIVIGKVAVYIYSSTDSLVISRFSAITGGLATVGELSNYNYVAKSAKALINSFVYSMTPALGNFLYENKEKKEVFKLFNNYTFVRHYIANVTATGLIICTTPLISLWFGSEFIIAASVVILICMDLFISITHGPINEFVSVLGLFQYEKYINAAGAVMNIVTSVIFVQFMGIEGVFLGTVLSQLLFWIGKSILVFKKYFEEGLFTYWRKVIIYIFVDVIQIIGIQFAVNRLFPNPSILTFVIEVIICIIIPTILTILLFFKTEEFKFTWQLAISILKKLRGAK